MRTLWHLNIHTIMIVDLAISRPVASLTYYEWDSHIFMRLPLTHKFEYLMYCLYYGVLCIYIQITYILIYIALMACKISLI